MNALDFENSPYLLKYLDLFDRNKLSEMKANTKVITICTHGVLKSYRAAIQLNNANISTKFIENGVDGLSSIYDKSNFTLYGTLLNALNSGPITCLIMSDFSMQIPSFQRVLRGLKNIAHYQSEEDAVAGIRTMFGR